MRLLIDLGNTALKWRLAGTVRGGSLVHKKRWPDLVARLQEALSGEDIESLNIASVAGPEAQTQLEPALERAFGASVNFIVSGVSALGVHNAYVQPERLGVDRWLAVVESWHRFGASIVIDAGSALTVDAVAGDGHHLGGYIVPGLCMLRNSLDAGTGSVRVDAVLEHRMTPGVSTGECVNHGTLLMAAAFVREAVVASRRTLPDTCPIIMTGGDAPVLAPRLGFATELVPDLVLDGLERISGHHLTGE